MSRADGRQYTTAYCVAYASAHARPRYYNTMLTHRTLDEMKSQIELALFPQIKREMRSQRDPVFVSITPHVERYTPPELSVDLLRHPEAYAAFHDHLAHDVRVQIEERAVHVELFVPPSHSIVADYFRQFVNALRLS